MSLQIQIDDDIEITEMNHRTDQQSKELTVSESLELLKELRHSEEVVKLYFSLLRVGKSWNDALCEKASEKLIKIAVDLDVVQNKVDKARVGTGSSSILSGIAGAVGFGLLFTPVTFPIGIIVLGVSAGVGGGATLTEVVANVVNWQNGKSKKKYIQNSFLDWAGIDCKQIADIAKNFGDIVNKIAKDKDKNRSKKKKKDKDKDQDEDMHDVVTLHLMSLFYFWSSFDNECRRLYGDERELSAIVLEAKDLLCEQSYPLRACLLYYQKIREAIKKATAASKESDKQDTAQHVATTENATAALKESDKQDTAQYVATTENATAALKESDKQDTAQYVATTLIDAAKDAATCASAATNAAKTASTTADAISDLAGTTGKVFANLGKVGQAFACLGCAFSIIGMGIGSYTIYDAVENIKDNEKNSKTDKKYRKSVNTEGKGMRILASMINLIILLRSTIRETHRYDKYNTGVSSRKVNKFEVELLAVREDKLKIDEN